MADKDEMAHYDGPAGGWGSLKGIASIFSKEWDTPSVIATLMRQNKPDGFACISCAWPKPAEHHPFEFCENGAKATLWELTSRRCEPEFFAKHSVSELKSWPDYDLEQQGRLTHPMRYDPETDHYVPVSWEDAFVAIGAELKRLDPKSVIFYASGRAGPGWNVPISLPCLRVYTATTTCPTVPTCATKQHQWPSKKLLDRRWVP